MRGRILIAVLLAAALAPSALGAAGVRWTVFATGAATPSGARRPVGYVAVTKAQEARFAARLDAADRAAIGRLELQRTGVVAVFLDGLPCGHDITVNRVVRTSSAVTVTLHWTRPPLGTATCMRASTPYVVLGVSRATLGRPAPTHVDVVAVARA